MFIFHCLLFFVISLVKINIYGTETVKQRPSKYYNTSFFHNINREHNWFRHCKICGCVN